MDYLLIFVLQLLGIGFHVMQKIMKIGDSFPEKTRKEIFDTFFKEDWDTLCVSALVLVLDELTYFIIDRYTPDFRSSINYYVLYAFGLAFVLGYSGQRLAYKWLGSAEKVLDSKFDNKFK
jgi:hypothetical protein